MDLISTIAQQVGLDPQQAQAVAGVVLGAVRGQVPAAEAQQLESAIPELGSWTKAADQSLEQPDAAPADGGLLGGLLAAAGSTFGTQVIGAVAGADAGRTAGVVAALSRLGVKAEHAALVTPVVVDFLVQRMGKEWADKIVAAAPLLAGLTGSSGGLTGMLSSFTQPKG
jgi:Protein of unknown function VcgC/VcgE (DUF2780)